jgi:hypothetical protein
MTDRNPLYVTPRVIIGGWGYNIETREPTPEEQERIAGFIREFKRERGPYALPIAGHLVDGDLPVEFTPTYAPLERLDD